MQVDFLTLACLRDHLDTLLGARVQNVVLPDERSIGLELYAGRRVYLLASAQAQAPRALLMPERPRRGVDTETPMLLLLRKWVRGARLTDVDQPPWERILILRFSGTAGECHIAVELMGRYSNVILVRSDGLVLEAVKRVGPRMSRYRTTLPGDTYKLPPLPENRVPPTAVTVGGWTSRLAQAPLDEPLHRWLVGQLLGVSPIAAQEIATKATGDPDALVRAAAPATLHQAVADVFAPLDNGWWAPHVALDENGAVVAFTPYEPRQFDRVEPVRDISEAMWRYFEARGMTDPYAAARRAVKALIDGVAERLDRRFETLHRQIVDEKDLEVLRVAGELLLTYQAQVPAGAHELSLPDYSGNPLPITLDPELTPVENAQAYFRRYDKARRAAEQIPGLIKKLEAERAYLEQLDADLMLAESRPEIDAVRDALAAAGWVAARRKSSGLARDPHRFEVAGFPIYVGRNARQNEQVTFERAGPEDLWLHVQGLPGAHVIIKRGRQEVPDEVLQRAAQMAAYYSRAREGETKVAVDVTERRFVRRMRGRFPGMVTYRNERTIEVRPEDWDPEDL